MTRIKITIGILVAGALVYIAPAFIPEEQEIGEGASVQYEVGELGNVKTIVRQAFADTEVKDETSRTSSFSISAKNTLKDGDVWQPIDRTFRPDINGFIMDGAPFAMTAPEFSDGTAEFINNNKWDYVASRKITSPATTMTIQARGVAKIKGQIATGTLVVQNGTRENEVWVEYNNVRPNEDLIYFVNMGMTPRMDKLLRFNATPPDCQGTSTITRSFSYTIDTDVAVKNVSKNDEWRDDRKLVVSEREKVSFNVLQYNDRGFTFLEPQIWDSAPYDIDTPRNIRHIKTEYARKQNAIVQNKIIPCDFFTTATFPVFTDTESTFNPDGNPETETFDGYYVVTKSPGTWNAAHDETTADSVNDSSTTELLARARETGAGTDFRILRSIVLFNTGDTLSSDATRNSCNLQLFVHAINDAGDDDSYTALVKVVETGSDTGATDTDYDELGASTPSTPSTPHEEYSDAVDNGGLTDDAYNTWTCDSDGISNIARSGESIEAAHTAGITYFGWMAGRDIVDEAPSTGDNDTINARAAGHASPPILTVDWDEASAGSTEQPYFEGMKEAIQWLAPKKALAI